MRDEIVEAFSVVPTSLLTLPPVSLLSSVNAKVPTLLTLPVTSRIIVLGGGRALEFP